MLKRLLNAAETATHERLRQACTDFGAAVHVKVRVADVLPIEGSGLSSRDFNFALRSHFDFVVVDADQFPQFAVEFDGLQHGREPQAGRDRQKNSLCKRFDLPLLRINARYLDKAYRGIDLLTWLPKSGLGGPSRQ
ncbi:MAG TPA: DUF2726 domain-containing protein [Thermoanaerobaculia bacterium]|nr:DUF2726 domain-containing protein [Thermoanaerobaculia bacterium]